MNKKDRFLFAYGYVVEKYLIKNQTEVAEKMGSTQQNVSAARKGNIKVLTDSFLKRFNNAFDNTFNIDWLLYGEGEPFANSDDGREYIEEYKKKQTSMLQIINGGSNVTQNGDINENVSLLETLMEQQKLLANALDDLRRSQEQNRELQQKLFELMEKVII